MRFPAVGLSLLAVLVLSGCDKSEEAASAPPPPEVTVSKPLTREITDWDDYVGQFRSVETVSIRPRVSGYLTAVSFTEGELVEKGDLLFSVDPRPFQAALDEAESRVIAADARVDKARNEAERAGRLIDTQAISQEAYDALESTRLTAEADRAAAEAAVRLAELNVEFTRITAPISGRVSYRRVDVGNAVRADDTVLTTITSVDPIQFVFQGSEALYLKYKRNAITVEKAPPVRIRLQDESEAQWTGHLDFLDNTIDPSSGTIFGRAVVANPDGFLTPGMFGHMELQASEPYTGILLPDATIATRGAQRIVYVVDAEGVVSAKQVILGPLLDDGLRVIRSGLTANDSVVIDGQLRARPGQAVTVIAGTIEVP